MWCLVYSQSISVPASVFTLISVATQKDEADYEELPRGEGMLKGDTQW